MSELGDAIRDKKREMFGDDFGEDFEGVGPLTRAEAWFASAFLSPAPDLDEVRRQYAEVISAGLGLVIGMAPGPRTSASLPMFPHPAGSAGGRLMAMSGMPVEAYLGRLRRANLCRGAFRVVEARERVQELYLTYRTVHAPHPRFVLCGRRVADVFSDVLRTPSDPWYQRRSWAGIEYATIPHPSGRCREYSDPANVARARKVVRWAARYEE